MDVESASLLLGDLRQGKAEFCVLESKQVCDDSLGAIKMSFTWACPWSALGENVLRQRDVVSCSLFW